MDDKLVAQLAAEAEIRNVIARLGHLADTGDLDEYITLFTDDAVWGMPTNTRRGRDDILAGAHERRATGMQGPGTHTRHVNTTLWVRIDGPDDAVAGSYYLFLAECDTQPVIRSTGRYEDRFRRTADGWKLASRNIVWDVN
jgi:uncharacterized protein (TIGR02246 family)